MTTPIPAALTDDQTYLLNGIIGKVQRLRKRNERLTAYYQGKAKIQSLGIAIPQEWDVLNTIVGWPAMAVDVLNERLHLDRFVVRGDEGLTERINKLWSGSNMFAEAPMLQANTFTHGCGFMVALSDKNAGPLLVPEPATRMSGVYDRRIRQMVAAASDDGRPATTFVRVPARPQATLYERESTTVVERDGAKWRVLNREANSSGILPVERLVNRPDFERVWGASEMTRPLISYTDSAVRTLMGLEVSREFYAAPQRYLLGVTESDFEDESGNQIPAWLSYIGKQLAIGRDEEGRVPEVGQFAASSPAPYIDVMKMFAQLASAETGITATRFGFVFDNPASADAIREANQGEIAKAESRRDMMRPAYAKAARLLLLADGVRGDQIPEIVPMFRSIANPTLAGQGDFTMKMVKAGVLDPMADSTLQQLPLEQELIEQIREERRKKAGAQLIENLAAAATVARQDPNVVALADRRTADAVAV